MSPKMTFFLFDWRTFSAISKFLQFLSLSKRVKDNKSRYNQSTLYKKLPFYKETSLSISGEINQDSCIEKDESRLMEKYLKSPQFIVEIHQSNQSKLFKLSNKSKNYLQIQ